MVPRGEVGRLTAPYGWQGRPYGGASVASEGVAPDRSPRSLRPADMGPTCCSLSMCVPSYIGMYMFLAYIPTIVIPIR